MKYNFDQIIERRGTDCLKYDRTPKDVIPLWIADMDFATPDFVMEAIQKRLSCPVLGYPQIPKDYFKTIAGWVKKLHGWNVKPEWMCFVPGIVKGIGLVEWSLIPRGSKVIIQPPVYHPFRLVSQKNEMELLYNPLIPVYEEECATGCGKGAGKRLVGYEMDFESLEKCMENGGKLLILSNPHNPAGICWSRETLEKVASLSAKHGVLVISDEIHAEMAHKGFKHIPFASVSEEAAQNSITFMSPSKTFNIAGVVSSYAIVPNPELRKRFFTFMEANELDNPSIFSAVVTMAAYKHGADWRKQMLRYVESNIAYVDKYLRRNIPCVKAMLPQASFLIWLDCSGLGLCQEKLVNFLVKKAHLFMNDGTMFGPEGAGFVRLNIACPRSVLTQALDQLRDAVAAMKCSCRK